MCVCANSRYVGVRSCSTESLKYSDRCRKWKRETGNRSWFDTAVNEGASISNDWASKHIRSECP
jgi:hypothetical protein